MEQGTMKFVKWMLLADLAVIIIFLTLGFIFIKSNHNTRFQLLGRGTGTFLVFSNLAALLIRHALKMRK